MDNQDMSDIVKNLTNMLGNDNIPENVKETLNQTLNNKTASKDSSISPEMLANLVNMFQSSHSENDRKCTNQFKQQFYTSNGYGNAFKDESYDGKNES